MSVRSYALKFNNSNEYIDFGSIKNLHESHFQNNEPQNFK